MKIPIEVIRHIYSFGYYEHRILTGKICDYIRIRGEIMNTNISLLMDDYRLYSDTTLYSLGIIEFINMIMNKDKQKELLVQTLGCYCCTRHSYKKIPINIGCRCRCRCKFIYKCLLESLSIDDMSHKLENSTKYKLSRSFKYRPHKMKN